MNIPNTITLLRVLLVPLLAWFLLHGEYVAAVWVLLGAGISDALDGFIARRLNQLTYLGSILDPLADKFLIIVSACILALLGLLPWWLTAVILLRDLIIVAGAIVYYLRAGSIEMNPSIPSKANTLVQTCLIFLVLGNAAGIMRATSWLPVLFGLALFTTTFSGVHYMVLWGRKGAELKKKDERRPATGGR
jgi:cardiolipin synthase (CMP-forming)